MFSLAKRTFVFEKTPGLSLANSVLKKITEKEGARKVSLPPFFSLSYQRFVYDPILAKQDRLLGYDAYLTYMSPYMFLEIAASCFADLRSISTILYFIFLISIYTLFTPLLGGHPVHKAGEPLDVQISLVLPPWTDGNGIAGDVVQQFVNICLGCSDELPA